MKVTIINLNCYRPIEVESTLSLVILTWRSAFSLDITEYSEPFKNGVLSGVCLANTCTYWCLILQQVKIPQRVQDVPAEKLIVTLNVDGFIKCNKGARTFTEQNSGISLTDSVIWHVCGVHLKTQHQS